MRDLISLGLKIQSDKILILDQEKLPSEEIWLESKSPKDMVGFMRTLKIRGAPLIGVAAAITLAKFSESDPTRDNFIKAAHSLREARPTAVNLMAAIDRMLKVFSQVKMANPAKLIDEAEKIFEEDVALCHAMGTNGAPLIESGDSILTHCNTGGLATAGIGTALSVIRTAWESRKMIHVYVDETRPLLQGARLTTWELDKLKIPYTLICDNMAAMLMRQKKVNKVIVGSDRIAKNGDFANKIGTYSVAVLAKHHGVPLFVVAPSTTIDMSCPNGDAIPIENRNAAEVHFPNALKNSPVYNPAFDMTPKEFVSAYILDTGVYTHWPHA